MPLPSSRGISQSACERRTLPTRVRFGLPAGFSATGFSATAIPATAADISAARFVATAAASAARAMALAVAMATAGPSNFIRCAGV